MSGANLQWFKPRDIVVDDVLGNVEFLNKSLTIGTKIFGFKNIFLLGIYDKLIHYYMETGK